MLRSDTRARIDAQWAKIQEDGDTLSIDERLSRLRQELGDILPPSVSESEELGPGSGPGPITVTAAQREAEAEMQIAEEEKRRLDAEKRTAFIKTKVEQKIRVMEELEKEKQIRAAKEAEEAQEVAHRQAMTNAFNAQERERRENLQALCDRTNSKRKSIPLIKFCSMVIMIGIIIRKLHWQNYS